MDALRHKPTCVRRTVPPPPYAFGFGWQATKGPDIGRRVGVGVSSGSPQGAKGDQRLWHVYFLGLSNGDIYVGSTNDLRRRMGLHRRGQVISTKLDYPLN